MSKSPAKASRAPLAAPAVPSPAHPLEAARKLLETLGEPGQWIWRTQKAWADDKVAPWTIEQRVAYLHRAIANQRRRLKEGGLDKYFHVPVDIQTFIECPLLMNKRTIVWPEVMPYLEAINDGTRTECVLTGGIGVAKALDIETMVPTGRGLRRLADIAVGDTLFDETGAPTKVLAAHPVLHDRPCYEVQFDDGASVVADAEHLWATRSWNERRKGRPAQVRTTLGMLATLRHIGKEAEHGIVVAGVAEMPARRLYIDPYTLGVWLGDGSSDDARLWSIDAEIIDRVRQAYPVRLQEFPSDEADDCPRYLVEGLRELLGIYGLLRDKHIPTDYLIAEASSRWELLRGLMDTDGTVSKVSGRCCFNSTNRLLAEQTAQLVASLGMKPVLWEGVAKLNGEVVGPYWRVGFMAVGENPCFLPRKADLVHPAAANGVTRYRYVKGIVPVATRPVRCLTVDSPSKLYCVTDRFIPTHNTTIALYTHAFQTYLLSALRDPHKMFDLDPSSEILTVFQSISKNLSKDVDYRRFRSMIEGAPYFMQHFPFGKDRESEMWFPRNVIVKPVAGHDQAAIGQNVIGGILDECLVAGTRIATETGDVAIEDVVAGMRVLGMTENGEIVSNAVVASRSCGVKQVFRLALTSGQVIVATGNHPIVTPAGEIALSNLQPGDSAYYACSTGSGGVRALAPKGEVGCNVRARAGQRLGFPVVHRGRVLSVTRLGHAEVFNFETRPTHTYIANGIVAHNCNFMAVVEKSKLSSDGGVYDQAVSNYNAIASRRESRFMVKGEVPGMLCLVSSRNYPGQFTDTKEKEARHNKRIFVYDMRIWELRPNRFKGERFRVFTGDDTRKPYILGARDKVASTDEKLVVEVPVEYRERFDGDILGALRDVAGVSTMALHPFIMDTDSVSACFGTALSIVSLEETDFRSSRLQIYPKRFANPSQPRFAHVDLAVTNDSCGLAVGHVPGFKPMKRGDEMEMLPLIQYDLLLRIRPPRQGEIEFEHVRKLLYKLRDLGLNIKWATFDTYQSIDSLQMLRQRGFVVGSQSMDEKPAPYEMTKQAFYDRRIRAPAHEVAQAEFARLEKDPKTRKIDHPVNGSKDVSDAMAGVCFGLTTRRDVWRLHGISLARIPVSVMEAARQSSGKGSVDHAERDPNNRRRVSYAEPVVIDG